MRVIGMAAVTNRIWWSPRRDRPACVAPFSCTFQGTSGRGVIPRRDPAAALPPRPVLSHRPPPSADAADWPAAGIGLGGASEPRLRADGARCARRLLPIIWQRRRARGRSRTAAVCAGGIWLQGWGWRGRHNSAGPSLPAVDMYRCGRNAAGVNQPAQDSRTCTDAPPLCGGGGARDESEVPHRRRQITTGNSDCSCSGQVLSVTHRPGSVPAHSGWRRGRELHGLGALYPSCWNQKLCVHHVVHEEEAHASAARMGDGEELPPHPTIKPGEHTPG